MKKRLILVLLLVCFFFSSLSCSVAYSDSIRWHSYKEGLAQGKKEGKKISPAESVGSASNTISQASLSGMSKVAGSNPDADFKAQAIQVIAANLGSKKATGSSKGIGGQSNKWARGTTRPTGNSAMKYSEEVLDSWMKANGYTEDDLYTPALDISGLQVKFGGIK